MSGRGLLKRWYSILALLGRIAGMGALCVAAVYVSASAFAPAVSSGRWEFVFIAIAGLGLVLGACVAVYDRAKDRSRVERDGSK
jgi:CBS-domain-containing membrane protein